MNKQRITKAVSILLILLLTLIWLSPYSNATEGDDWWTQGKNFIDRGSGETPIKPKQIENTLMPIGRTLVTIATIVLTVVTIVMAIKYMMCDNADEKAKLKTQLIGLVVSTIVIYGAQIIWALIYKFMLGVTGEIVK